MVKKIIGIIAIMFLLNTDIVNATIECKYKLSIERDQKKLTDYITFYFEPGGNVEPSFYIDSTKLKYSIDNTLGSPDGKIFSDKNLYLDYSVVMTYPFLDNNNKTVLNCPSILSNMIFAVGNGAIDTNSYVLMNQSYDGELIHSYFRGNITLEEQMNSDDKDIVDGKCYCCGNSQGCTYRWLSPLDGAKCGAPVEKSRNECVGNTSNDLSKKNCGQPMVFNMNSYLNASQSQDYALKAQYYIEGYVKYITLTLKRGGTELEPVTYKLHPEVGNILQIDYYKTYFGGSNLSIQTFDKCEELDRFNICRMDSGGFLIGPKCDEKIGGDPETETQIETVKEYEERYADRYGSLFPTIGFGPEGMRCEELLGPTLTDLIRSLILIVRGVGIGICVLNGMMSFIPALIKKDKEALNASLGKFAKLLIILVFLLLLPDLIKLISWIGGFDDLSCIFG